MAGKTYEIRDPIHAFIRFDADERKIIDSRPFQRLRHIHQLALTYLVYPGATHRRFEHSLGVMEVASRIYDVVTNPENIHDETIRRILPRPEQYEWHYWRRVLRMAALCHDLGHLPFSHAAEKQLLPEGWNHELISMEIICDKELKAIWDALKIQPNDVGKLAVGPKYYQGETFSDWEAILSEIVTSDAFGADRIDYLLRDSYHAGVAYGRFDHYRLIDTICVLPRRMEDESEEPALGIEEGGLQSAESLLWARYLMYTQLYFHPVRRIYDIHLQDFIKAWLNGGYFSTDVEDHLQMTDNEVTAAISKAAGDLSQNGHMHAHRITERGHFRLLYSQNPKDQDRNLDSVRCVYNALIEEYGEDAVRRDSYKQRGTGISFPVRARDGRIHSSLTVSVTLKEVPTFAVDCIFIDPTLRDEARKWLDRNLETIIPQ